MSVPSDDTIIHGVRARCSYGIVVCDADSGFPGAWWKIYYGGKIEKVHIHTIQPLWDSEGRWLQAK